MSDQTLAAILAALDRLEVGQSKLEVGQSKMVTHSDLAQLRADLMARMDRLQEGFTQLQHEISVNFSATERVDRRAQSAHDEIKLVVEMVNEMMRMVRRLDSRVSALEEPKA